MNRTMTLLLVILTFFFGSCNTTVDGSGNVVTQARSVADFSEIEVAGAFEVVLSQGAYGVKVEADDNIIGEIDTRVSGKVLRVSHRKNFGKVQKMRVYVSTPALTRLDLKGACSLKSTNKLGYPSLLADVSGASRITLNIDCDKLTIDGSGASRVELTGKSNRLEVDLNGASTLSAVALVTQKADVDLSGASTGSIFAVESLNVDLSGASTLSYKGTPEISQDITGASTLRQLH